MTTRDPSTIDADRSQLIHALREAVELEHTLMCQYLFAAMSLKTQPDEYTGKRKNHQYEMVRTWKRSILRVAREEMQHLAWAVNLLVAAGGSPMLGRPNFPNVSKYYHAAEGEGGLPMTLRRFDCATAKRFVAFEAPSEPTAGLGQIPEPNFYASVGDLYARARELFSEDTFVVQDFEQYDPIDEAQQGVRLPLRRRVPNTVRSVDEARALIDEIVRQGEGAADPGAGSHHQIFCNIRSEYERELEHDAAFEPSRPVVDDPMIRRHVDSDPPAENLVPGPPALQWQLLQAFNTSYEILLLWLSQLFAHSGGVAERRAVETLVYLPLMTEVLAPLSDIITQIPFDSERPELGNLGPSFEIVTGDIVLTAPSATERVATEKLSAIASFIEASQGPAAAVAPALGTQLAYVEQTVRLIHDELVSRRTHGWPPTASDIADEVRGTQFDCSERCSAGWVTNSAPRYLSLRFRGWFQSRLATDPDSSQHTRGATGNSFAWIGEPELDRVIRFRPDEAIGRSHCPPIGVEVFEAQILELGQEQGTQVPEWVGATVALLGNPKFIGRNHITSEDGEPIDPFELDVRSKAGEYRLSRAVLGSGILEADDMTPLERRATGRYPVAPPRADKQSLAENFRVARSLGTEATSPLSYLEDRQRRLRQDLERLDKDDPLGIEHAQVAARLRFLDEFRPGTMPWMRFFFQLPYRHTISSLPMTADVPGGKVIGTAPWLIEYRMGLYDSDALSALVWGELRVPWNDDES
jgi:hypothetical protein